MKLRAAVTIGALISIFLAVVLSAPFGIEFSELAKKIITSPVLLLAICASIILQFIGHWMRSIRHRIILNQVRPVRTYEIFKGQSIGYLFNFILPFRIGELVRAHYIARGVSISRSAVFATIVFERFIDLLIIQVLALPILLLLFTTHNVSTILYIFITLTFASVAIGYLLYSARSQKTWLLRSVYHFSNLFNEKTKDTIRLMAWSGVYILKNAINKKISVRYAILSFIMWAFYLSSTLLVVIATLPALSFVSQWLVVTAAYLGISIPSGPAYLTSFQPIFTSVSNLDMHFLHDNNITLLIWAVLVIPVSLVGLIFLFMPHKKYVEKQSDMVTVLKNKLYRDVDITKDFAHFLNAYFQGSKINRILTNQEFINNFKIIRTFRGGSSALTLLAWQDETMVVKKITLKQFAEKLRAQYEWLRKYKKNPEIADVIAEVDGDDFYSIDVKFEEKFIPFFDTIHSSTISQSAHTLNSVLDFMDNTVYKKPQIFSKPKLARKYIREKALEKIADSSKVSTSISNLLPHRKLIVNGQSYHNFYQIIEKILNNKQAMTEISHIEESDIHGDLTVDNIIVSPKNNSFIILDPNNENFISDKVVDIGKIMQSTHSGYEFLILLNRCDVKENKITFEESKSYQYAALYEELNKTLKKSLTPERYRVLLFHEAMHYTRMLPYRVDLNPATAPVFYAVGVRLFNEFYAQYER